MGESRSFKVRTAAKINLMLDVIRKREDGFHEIDSLFQNISLYDEIFVNIKNKRSEKPEPNLNVECNFEVDQKELEDLNKKNILYKVFEKVSDKVEYDFDVLIVKNIPTGAGLGGGSSNAAGFIALLEELKILDRKETFKIAESVGSDVPFFLYGGTAIVRGRGEIIEPLEPIKGYSLDLICPNFRISTKEAYGSLKKENFSKAPLNSKELYEAYKIRDFEKVRRGSYNIFESILPVDKYKSLFDNKTIEHSVSLLTGSGSCYFTVYFDQTKGKLKFIERGIEIYAQG